MMDKKEFTKLNVVELEEVAGAFGSALVTTGQNAYMQKRYDEIAKAGAEQLVPEMRSNICGGWCK